MHKLFKKILKSKKFIFFLNAYGVFSAASFLFLTFFMPLALHLAPSCSLDFALIGFTRCSDTFFGHVLSLYMNYFSPVAIGIVMLAGYGFFQSLIHFELLRLLQAALLLSVIGFSVFAALRIVIKQASKLLWRADSFSKKQKQIAALLLLSICLPVGSAFAYHTYKAPPAFLPVNVTINMWHDEFSVPREYLERWSIYNLERPDKEPQGFKTLVYARGSKLPYANLKVPLNLINPKYPQGETIFIKVSPRYELADANDIRANRKTFLENELVKTERLDRQTIERFDKKAKMQDEWKVYRANNVPGRSRFRGYIDDILLSENDQGQIEHLLRCMPDDLCMKKDWHTSNGEIKTYFDKCEFGDSKPADQLCKSLFSGTDKYKITFEFDKKNLGEYSELKKGVISFVNSLGVKNP